MIKVYGADVEFMKFSAGEPHVKVTNIEEQTEIDWKFESFEELMQIAMICDVLNRNDSSIILNILYVPFARQDRATTVEQPFSLQVFCNMLRSIPVHYIFVRDVHSDVFFDLMVGSPIVVDSYSQFDCARDAIPFWKTKQIDYVYDCIIAPDKGAVRKAEKFSDILNIPLICATKVRDPLTGQLSAPTIDFGDLKPKHALIPDDICDGGGTFIQLADVIKQQFPEIKLDLYVTHGIFSRGKKELNKRFNQIYVYNDMSKENKDAKS